MPALCCVSISSDGKVEHKHYLTALGDVIGEVVKRDKPAAGQAAEEERYWVKDHLGSNRAILGSSGQLLESLGFDAWGKRRYASGQTDAANPGIAGQTTDRGYTGHEHLDELGLINMNARIDDPLLGRFLSPDPEVTDEERMQNYNRYAYVMNNPLSYTDPSGEFAVFAAPAVASQISGFMGAGAGLSIGAAIAESIDLVDGEAFDRIAADARLDSRSPKIGKPSSQSLDARQVGKAKPDVGRAYVEAPQKNESQVSESRQKKPLDAAQAKGVGRKPNRTAGSMGAPDPEDDPDDKYANKNYGGKKKSPQKKANENRQPASEKRVDKLGNDLEKSKRCIWEQSGQRG